MRKLAALLLGFAYMVLLIESVRVATAWWSGALKHPDITEWLLLAALPLLAWIWWRYLSVFRKDCGKIHCALPERESSPTPPHLPRI